MTVRSDSPVTGLTTVVPHEHSKAEQITEAANRTRHAAEMHKIPRIHAPKSLNIIEQF
jgi:hypothetical protein